LLLASLKRIQELASQGVPLIHMKALLRGGAAAALSLAEVQRVAAFVRGLIERRIDDADES
jgi:hypothetical protein